MSNAIDLLGMVRRQLLSRVRDAIDDAPPEVAESAVGKAVQAGALVEAALELMASQMDPGAARNMLSDMLRRTPVPA